MNNPPDIAGLARAEQEPAGSVNLYRDKRFFRSLLAGFCVLFVTAYPFIAFASYVFSGLFWDWLFFTREGRKDSEQAPKSYFEEIGITSRQMDEFNEFMVKVRRRAVAVSIVATAACLLFFPAFAWKAVFVVAYTGINFGSLIAALSKGKIIWPYPSEGQKEEDHVTNSGLFSSMPVDRIFFDPPSDNPTVNPFWLTAVKPPHHPD